MTQMTLAVGTGFELHARPTRKAEFLAKMDGLMPWPELCALIEPHYPKAGNGRPPIGLERMLRMYWVALLLEAKEALSNQFKSLANDILEEKSKRFTEQNQTNIGQLLNPLKERMTEFKAKVEEIHTKDTEQQHARVSQAQTPRRK